MKHDELRSIGHNIADSFACGNGFLIGYYSMDVYEEAALTLGRCVTVDFLRGAATEGDISASLARAIELYRDALPGLCERHGASVSEIAELKVRYSISDLGKAFTVTVADSTGRRSTTEYQGIDSHRVRILDDHGRVRPKPVRRPQ